MNTDNKAGGIFIGIDLGDMRRSLEAREKLKSRAVERVDKGVREHREDPNFKPNRLVNTLQEKGRVLDIVV